MPKRYRALGALSALAVVLATAAAVSATEKAAGGGPAVVKTDRGPVRGVLTEDRRDFFGVPFAAPPVGELRWASPVPPSRWTRPLEANKPGPGCAQVELPPYEASESEDCLYVNVSTPRRAEGRRLPVMVWFHGGGFSNGAGIETKATELASRGNVVVVTVNYRLGVFGFLDHPALDGGTARQRSGNFGLEDQQAALRWVRRNAAAFGGDAGNVTLFGQWSGGKSVCVQMTAPGAAGLFHRAITMSNPCLLEKVPEADGRPDPTPLGLPRPRAEAESQGIALAKDLGCTDQAQVVACLRAKSTALLLEKAPPLEYTPVHGGGGVLPVDPLEAFRAGRFAKVPMLHGVNRDAYRTSEAFLEEWGSGPLTEEEYEKRVRNFVGAELAEETLARYPVAEYGKPSLAWSALATDALLARPMLDTARLLAPRVPVYGYEFADDNAPWYAGVPEPSFPTGSYQDSELQYLFDTVYFAGRRFTPEQRRLSNQMIDYFARFARTGSPGGAWPASNGDPDLVQVLAPGAGGVRPGDLADGHQYGFWRSVDY